MAWQSKEQSWAVEQSPARLRAQRVVPVVHPALSHRARPCQELPQLCPSSAGCPEPSHVLHAPTFSPLAQVSRHSAKVGQERPECAKVRGRNDPTLPHPRLESRNNSKTGERQSSRQNNTVPAHGSQPAVGLGEKELTAGAEQGWVSWSLRQQRLLCCTTWLGLLSSQLT